MFSVIATEVEPTLGLLSELNAINVAEPQVKVVQVDGSILARVEIVATALDPDELGVALRRIEEAVSRYRPLLEAYFTEPEHTD